MNKKSLLFKSIAVSIAISVAGCASIIGKSSYPVAIKSTPDGTHFVIKNHTGDAIHTGETPATVTLNSSKGYFKKAEYTVTFTKEGFKEQTVPLTASLDGWYFGNILLGGLIGMLIVDPATGAMWKLPNDVGGNLAHQDATAKLENGIAPELQVVTLDQIPDAMKSQLIELH